MGPHRYKRKSKSAVPRGGVNDARVVPLLKSIDESLANQQTSSEPLVKDVIIPPIKRNKVYTFEQSTTTTITSSTTLEVDGGFQLNLAALGLSSSFTNIFDAYRIIGATFKFVPITTVTGQILFTAIDYDDINTTTITNLLQYETLKMSPSGSYFERSFVPRVAPALYSGTFTSFGQNSYQWIDCASTNVQHYGLKYGFPIAPNSVSYQIVVVYKIQFRNTR